MRNGELGPAEGAAFLPVRIMPEMTGPTAATAPAVASRKHMAGGDTTIEIALPDGTTVRVGRDVGAVALRRVPGALRG